MAEFREPGSTAAGVLAGSVAAIAAVALNLPLESPSDAYMNSGSVAIGSLGFGLLSGLLWRLLAPFPVRRPLLFTVVMALSLLAVSVAAIIGESYVERSVSYIVPVAGLVVVATGSLTILLGRMSQPLPWRLALLTGAIALGLGLALSGQGDQESGRLELPPRPAALQPASAVGGPWNLG